MSRANRLFLSAVVTLFLFVMASDLSAQSAGTTPSRDDVWVPARDAMQQALRKLENFTCIQNISRTVVPADSNRKQSVKQDRIRLQVTHADGKEFYAFPGDPASVTEPHLLVKTGLSGTGGFLGYARAIFLRQPFSRLQLVGRETLWGEPVYRFSFVFDLREKLNITRAGDSGSVGAKGEFTIGANDSLVKSIHISSAGPIPELGIESVEYEIHWARLQGSNGFLLIPQHTSFSMKMFTGEVQQNAVELTQCREFQTESTIRFDVEDEETAPTAAPAALLSAKSTLLPAGLTLALRLTEEIDFRKASVGDRLQAEVTRAIDGPNGVSIPVGAITEARVRRLEHMESPSPHTVAWIELTSIRNGNQVFLGLAELQQRDHVRGLVNRLTSSTTTRTRANLHEIASYRDFTNVEELIYPSIPGVGAFLFDGEAGVLPTGYRMTWKTLPAQSSSD